MKVTTQKAFDAKQFAEEVRKEVSWTSIYEMYQANFLTHLLRRMDHDKLCEEHRQAVLRHEGFREQDIPSLTAEGYAAQAEAARELYGKTYQDEYGEPDGQEDQ
jgi:hypothetical protein